MSGSYANMMLSLTLGIEFVLSSLINLLEIALLVWLGALSVVVTSKLVNGDIATVGIFHSQGTEGIDPERVGLFMVTLGIAFYYVIHTLRVPLCDVNIDDCSLMMPDLPEEALYVFGGGQGAYLGGKVIRIGKGIFGNDRFFE
ncbi:hypothetical protein [uncultured Roseobacter sp.]|nr:hypothetical protein [uncultured Roseobacter sp.]